MKTLSSKKSSNSTCRDRSFNRTGFTLTELIVTIGIIAILLGISFPAMQMIRQTARRTHCSSNLRQVMVAALAYEANGTGFPPADDGQGGSFLVKLLPHMEETILNDRVQMPLDVAIGETFGERLQELSNDQIELLICPAAFQQDKFAALPMQGEFTTHYYGLAGPIGNATSSDTTQTYTFRQLMPAPAAGPIGLNGLFSPKPDGKFGSRGMADVADGTSNTFSLGEISGYDKDDVTADSMRSGWAFGAGYDSGGKVQKLYGVKSISQRINELGSQLNTLPFGSNHPGGTHFAFVDGSIHFVEDNISLDILKTYASIDKGEKDEVLE